MRRPVEIIEKYKTRINLSEVELDFVKEWDYEYNKGYSPEDFKPQSNKKVWWRCRRGHSWEARIQRRFFGDGCPYCSGKKVSDDNCLSNANPKLAKEWNFAKNDVLTPDSVTSGSSKKVWWICGCGHEWRARIDHRNNGSGCPACRRGKLT